MRASGERHSRSEFDHDQDWDDDNYASDERTRQLVLGATGAAVGLVCLAVVAVLVAAAIPDPPEPEAQNRGRQPDVNWDGLDARTRSAFVLMDSRVKSQPTRLRETTALVQNASRDYAVDRAAEIQTEIARIDANPWRGQDDLDRRRALAEELSRLAR